MPHVVSNEKLVVVKRNLMQCFHAMLKIGINSDSLDSEFLTRKNPIHILYKSMGILWGKFPFMVIFPHRLPIIYTGYESGPL